MKTPLLLAESEEVLQPQISWSKFGWILIFGAAVVFLSLNNVSFTLKQKETDVGSPPNWFPLLKTYFGLLSLILKAPGDPYILLESPVVEMSECDGHPETISCEDACELILNKKPVTPLCYKIPREGSLTKYQGCWNTTIMGCWGKSGEIPVYLGKDEFLLHRKYNAETVQKMKIVTYVDKQTIFSERWNRIPGMHWMHFSHEINNQEIILFGWGSVNPIDMVCDLVQKNKDIQQLVSEIPPDRSILIGGHSEGSRWAICFNELLADKKLPNPRRLITTGSIVAPESFFESRWDRYNQENSLFLVVGLPYPEDQPNAVIMPDVYTISKTTENGTFVTFPQFGYKCDGYGACLSINVDDKPFDFNEGIQMLRTQGEELEEVLHDHVHAFRTYRECFQQCLTVFRQTPGFNFKPNMPSFQLYTKDQKVLALFPYSRAPKMKNLKKPSRPLPGIITAKRNPRVSSSDSQPSH